MKNSSIWGLNYYWEEAKKAFWVTWVSGSRCLPVSPERVDRWDDNTGQACGDGEHLLLLFSLSSVFKKSSASCGLNLASVCSSVSAKEKRKVREKDTVCPPAFSLMTDGSWAEVPLQWEIIFIPFVRQTHECTHGGIWAHSANLSERHKELHASWCSHILKSLSPFCNLKGTLWSFGPLVVL